MGKKFKVVSELNGVEKVIGHYYGSGEHAAGMAVSKAQVANGDVHKKFFNKPAVAKAIKGNDVQTFEFMDVM